MAGVHTERDVGDCHATGDGGHATDNDGEQFALSDAGQVRLNDEGRFGLAHKDVRRGGKGFTAAGAHGALHDPRHCSDDALKDAEMIQKR